MVDVAEIAQMATLIELVTDFARDGDGLCEVLDGRVVPPWAW